jgi:hypothetical protein
MWVIGSEGGACDVWASSNGSTWTQVTNAAAWGNGRQNFGVAALNNQLWVVGGHTNSVSFNDVWSSTNGAVWTQVNSAAPWAARDAAGSFTTLNGQLCLIRGQSNGTALNDVWLGQQTLTNVVLGGFYLYQKQ